MNMDGVSLAGWLHTLACTLVARHRDYDSLTG